MSSFEYELNFLNAGVEELEAYLLSSELYWPIGIGTPRGQVAYPQLTLGNLLLSQRKAVALGITLQEEIQVEKIVTRISNIQEQWRTAWSKKASREFSSRINLWRNFLDDYQQKPDANYDRYGYEVGRRVLLELLAGSITDKQSPEIILLDGLDAQLRSRFEEGEFIWDEDLISGFPQDPFWYLYGQLRI